MVIKTKNSQLYLKLSSSSLESSILHLCFIGDMAIVIHEYYVLDIPKKRLLCKDKKLTHEKSHYFLSALVFGY